jgi:hypothetical protein
MNMKIDMGIDLGSDMDKDMKWTWIVKDSDVRYPE